MYHWRNSSLSKKLKQEIIGTLFMTMFNPAHPSEILKELIVDALGLTISDAANHLDISRKRYLKF